MLAAVLVAACSTARPEVRPVIVLQQDEQARVFHNLVRAEGDGDPGPWDFETPHRLRPCCAFGSGLSVRLGYLPIAGLRLDNVVEPSGLGRHKFNSGMVSLSNEPSNAFLSPEKNGLLYTCRGGFIDTAHIRDYADWTVFLIGRFDDLMDSGGTLVLPNEGGERYLHVAAVPPQLIEEVGRDELAIRLAQSAAIHIAIWHETASWYGWSSWGIFPETASAFSPEDLYSNLVGIMLATELIREGLADNVTQYEASMEVAMPEVLRRLEGAPGAVTRAAIRSVDGRWWDSKRPLPDKAVLLRRSFDIGPEIRPWMAPLRRDRDGRIVREYCADRPSDVLELRYPTEIAGEPLRYLVRLEVVPEPRLADRMAADRLEDRWVSQEDFAAIVGRARAENRVEFGHDADRP